MVIRIGNLLGWVTLSAGLLCLFSGSAGDGQAAPAIVQTHTYRFTACIKVNAGITPLKVGETIKGTFTYDLHGENLRPDVRGLGRYRSKRNALSFQYGDLRFKGVGDISASVTKLDNS